MKRITTVILLLAIMCLTAGCDDWRTDAFRSTIVASVYSRLASGLDSAAATTADALGDIIGTVLVDILEGLL